MIEVKVKFAPIAGALARPFTITDVLWIIAVLGLALRILYPFYDNPFVHLQSDSLRHFTNAATEANHTVFSAADALGYRVWLAAVVQITGKSLVFTALYAGLLSASTAILWFLWFRAALPNQMLALIAFDMIAWLPNWIKIFSYFMQETLALPLCGLMLWCGWRAKRTLRNRDAVIFAVIAALSFITKASSLPLIAITSAFLFRRILKSIGRREAISIAINCAFVAALICLLPPVSFYSKTGSWSWILPVQADTNRRYFASGKRELDIDVHYFDRFEGKWRDESIFFGNPAYYTPQLVPFSNWFTPREGAYRCVVDFAKPPGQRVNPDVNPSLEQRVKLTLENWIYLFVGFSWPTEFPQSKISFERWLWPFFTLAILAAWIKSRKPYELYVLSMGTLLVLMFQQECVMDGHYRIIWEGAMIPAVVLAISQLIPRRKEIEDQASGTSGMQNAS